MLRRLFVLVVLSTACGAPATSESPAPERPAAAASAPAAALTPRLATVELLDAGQEPRAPLQIRVTPGQTESLAVVVKIGVGIDAEFQRADHTATPSIALRATFTARTVDSSGDATYDMVLDELRLHDPAAASPTMKTAYEATLADISPIRGTMTRTDRGVPTALELRAPADLQPRSRIQHEILAGVVADLLPVFPDEPVGVGARWTVRQQIRLNDITVDGEARVELRERDRDRCRLALTLNPSARPQKLDNAILPTSRHELSALAGSGTGAMQIDLTRVAPREAHSSLMLQASNLTESLGMQSTIKTSLSVDVEAHSLDDAGAAATARSSEP